MQTLANIDISQVYRKAWIRCSKIDHKNPEPVVRVLTKLDTPRPVQD